MKKQFTILLLAMMVVQLVCPQVAEARVKQNLYSVLEDYRDVNIYIRNITDSSGSSGELVPLLKKDLVSALKLRQSTNFVMVNDEKDADIIITCDITGRVWQEVDPVDMVYNVVASAHDAMTEENFSRLEATFLVEKGPRKVVFRRIGNRRILWDKNIQATVTKKIMPEDESIPLVVERIVEVFMRKCFSKNAKV